MSPIHLQNGNRLCETCQANYHHLDHGHHLRYYLCTNQFISHTRFIMTCIKSLLERLPDVAVIWRGKLNTVGPERIGEGYWGYKQKLCNAVMCLLDLLGLWTVVNSIGAFSLHCVTVQSSLHEWIRVCIYCLRLMHYFHVACIVHLAGLHLPSDITITSPWTSSLKFDFFAFFPTVVICDL